MHCACMCVLEWNRALNAREVSWRRVKWTRLRASEKSFCQFVVSSCLLLFPLVCSPLAWTPLGSRASPEPLIGLSREGLWGGAFWAPWRPLGLLGPSWASPGSLLASPLGPPLARSWPLLGCPWVLLGLFWALLGQRRLSTKPLKTCVFQRKPTLSAIWEPGPPNSEIPQLPKFRTET